jgi:hypothetical protein
LIQVLPQACRDVLRPGALDLAAVRRDRALCAALRLARISSPPRRARSIFSRSVSRASEIDKAEFEEKRKLLGR